MGSDVFEVGYLDLMAKHFGSIVTGKNAEILDQKFTFVSTSP
jgi:hypothetical protein